MAAKLRNSDNISLYAWQCEHELADGIQVTNRIVRNEESQVGITQNGGNSDQTSPSTRNNAHIFPGVLAFLALSVVLVVQIRDGLAERLNACGWSILTGSD